MLRSFHAGCSESTGDEEDRRWRIFCTSRKPDVYGALSAACYVHSTQAAQKVPETKKVVDGVLLVRRDGLMMYTVLYQQLAKFISRRLLRKCRRRRRSNSVRRGNLMKYTVLYQQLATFIPHRLLRKYRRRRRSTKAYFLYVEAT